MYIIKLITRHVQGLRNSYKKQETAFCSEPWSREMPQIKNPQRAGNHIFQVLYYILLKKKNIPPKIITFVSRAIQLTCKSALGWGKQVSYLAPAFITGSEERVNDRLNPLKPLQSGTLLFWLLLRETFCICCICNCAQLQHIQVMLRYPVYIHSWPVKL